LALLVRHALPRHWHYYSHVQQGRLNKLYKDGWPSRPYATALTVEFTVRTVQHQPPLQWPTVRIKLKVQWDKLDYNSFIKYLKLIKTKVFKYMFTWKKCN
jgi:hypothetical protein